MVKPTRKLSPSSWLVAAGRPAGAGEALNTPLVPASNFVLGGERAYSRDDGTPTWEALEDVVGRLEEGRAVAFSSGMAAIAAVFDELSTGAVVVIPTDCYQGVVGLALEGQRKKRWSVERLAVEDTDGWVRARTYADLVWLETPSNPLLVVADLATICASPRKPGAIVAVDNTFATPLNQRPLDVGADVAVQSATKLIGGHSDLLAGVAATRNESLYEKLRTARELSGATPGALEAFLAVRGARTLAVRVERAQATAMMLAQRLEAHSRVTTTRYPGLASHPTHDTAKRQLRGFGTVISFDVAGDATAADGVCARLALIRHATSLGGVETTIERRAAVSGQGHLPPSLLRLSVGIEDPEDLWADLSEALRPS
jgi:cystathionine gamma-synthase